MGLSLSFFIIEATGLSSSNYVSNWETWLTLSGLYRADNYPESAWTG
jgi:hypothetical protein